MPISLKLHLCHQEIYTLNIGTSLIELFPTCDEWKRLWQRQISLPLQIRRVVGSWYRDIVSLPFCLHYQAFWNGVGGVVGGGVSFLIIDLHDPVWKVLISVDLIKELFLSFFEWGWQSGYLPGVRMLWWNWRGCFSTWVETEGCNELAGYVKTCMHLHTKVCKSEVWNLIQAYLSDCLTTGNHSPSKFHHPRLHRPRLPVLKELQMRYFPLAHTRLEPSEGLSCIFE